MCLESGKEENKNFKSKGLQRYFFKILKKKIRVVVVSVGKEGYITSFRRFINLHFSSLVKRKKRKKREGFAKRI